MHKNHFVNSPLRLLFLIALTREEEIGPRSGRAGPPFSVRPEKEAKGAVLHGTSAAERSRHVETRSAGRTKTRRLTALKQFVRPFFHRARRDEKIPSRATQSDSAGAASAFKKLLELQEVSSASNLCGSIFRGAWGTFPHACFSCFLLFASSKEKEVAYGETCITTKVIRRTSPDANHAFLCTVFFDLIDKLRLLQKNL